MTTHFSIEANQEPSTGNVLRVLEKVEAVARSMRPVKPAYEVFEGRTDLVKHDSPPTL